jgi:hypothetical protein
MRDLDDFDLRQSDREESRLPPMKPAGPGGDPRGGRGDQRRAEPAADRASHASSERPSGPGDPDSDPPLRQPTPPTDPSAWDDDPSSSWNDPIPGRADVERRDRNRAVGVVAVLIRAGALVAAFWMMSRRVDPPEPGTASEAERAEETTPATGDEPPRSSELEAPLPPLDQSDALVRRLVGALSSQPALTAWLATGNLIRTFTAAVENASLGASPSPNLPFLRPREP